MKEIKNSVIAYTVCRVLNSGLYISVQNGEVAVSAPWYFTKTAIQNAVEERAKWISEKLREYEDRKIKERKYINGKTAKVFGNDVEVVVLFENVKLPKLELEEKCIKITLPNSKRKMDNTDVIGILLEKMYERLAQERIENVLEKIRYTLGIVPEDYEIKRIKNNVLGKCIDYNKIIINPDVTRYSKNAIEYLVLHECCHLKFKTHAKGFYEIIRNYMPEYKKYEEELRNMQF